MIGRLPVSKALRLLLETGTGKPCGYGRLPVASDGSPVAAPYSVLTAVGAATSGAAWGDGSDLTELLYQVTSVGGGRADQAEWLADRTADVLIGQRPDGTFKYGLVVPGVRVLARRLTDDVGVADDGGTVSHVARYAVIVTGA